MPTETTLAHLRQLYRARADPWEHHSSAYEREKYDRTMSAIAGLNVDTALEIGCGTGALTARLADRCGRVIAVDCVPAALREAERHLAGARNVDFCHGEAPDDLPACQPDLVVLSEVLYYLEVPEIVRLARWSRSGWVRPTTILCVNWGGPTGQTLSGAEAMKTFADACECLPQTEDCAGFRIDLMRLGETAKC